MKLTQKTWNVHDQRKNFALETQHNLYFTDSRWGSALGETHILCFAESENIALQWNIGFKTEEKNRG